MTYHSIQMNNKKEKLYGQKENEELAASYKEARRQTKERTTDPLASFSKDLKDSIKKFKDK